MNRPLKEYRIPKVGAPGAFGTIRKHDIHTGVDLYTKEYEPVYAIENGCVVAIEIFTGPKVGFPWWNETWSVLIEGDSGVFCYGEISPLSTLNVGKIVNERDVIGHVLPVLRPGKERPDIEGHSRFMLHLELYEKGTKSSCTWNLNEDKSAHLLDPTSILERLLETK